MLVNVIISPSRTDTRFYFQCWLGLVANFMHGVICRENSREISSWLSLSAVNLRFKMLFSVGVGLSTDTRLCYHSRHRLLGRLNPLS